MLTCITWLKWGDPVIDTGREIETAWKVSLGSVLYRDIAYNYGPLSPYLNAALLDLFGASLRVLVLCGVVAAAAGMWLVYLSCRIFLGRPASSCIAAVFLFECAFQHYYTNGNFNFVLPYSFPAVHGTLAALASFVFLARNLDTGKRVFLVAAGSLAGLSFLCKIEIASAILVPLAAAPLFLRLGLGRGIKPAVLDAVAWAAPFLALTAAGFTPFVAAASFETVVWRNVLRPQLMDFTSNLFFMEHLGLSALKSNLFKIFISILIWAAVAAGIFFGVSRIAGNALSKAKGQKNNALLYAEACLLCGAAAALAWFALPPDIEFRCLPIVCSAAVIVSAFILLKKGRKHSQKQGEAKLFALSLFAMLALVRIFMTAGPMHYGFCLALPGIILFAVTLHHVPLVLFKARNHGARTYGIAVICLLLVLSCRNFFFHTWELVPDKDGFTTVSTPSPWSIYRKKEIELSGPGGTMMIHPLPRGYALKKTLDHLLDNGSEDQTLLVLPEGALFNFLTGQVNPTPYNIFIPPELNAPGIEEKLIHSLKKHAVDRILLIDRKVWEYGFMGLGIDYGLALMDHVKCNYKVEASFGRTPYSERAPCGCVVYRIKGKKQE